MGSRAAAVISRLVFWKASGGSESTRNAEKQVTNLLISEGDLAVEAIVISTSKTYSSGIVKP